MYNKEDIGVIPSILYQQKLHGLFFFLSCFCTQKILKREMKNKNEQHES